MSRRFAKSPLKSLAAYIVAALLPISLLLYLEYQSLARQKRTIDDLSAANKRLAGAQAVETVERVFEWDVERVLRNPQLIQIAAELRSKTLHSPSSASAREIWGPAREDFLKALYRLEGLEALYTIDDGRVFFLGAGLPSSHAAEIAGLLEANRHLLEDVDVHEKMYPLAFTRPTSAQIFFIERSEGHYLVASIALDHTLSHINAVAQQFGVPYAVRVVDQSPIDSNEVAVRFQTLFPFWQLAVRTSDRELLTLHQLVFGLLTAFVLLFLGIGLVFVVREGRRHWQDVRLRETFIQAVSHDFRTPVANLLIYAELLSADSNTPAQTREFQQTILSQARSLKDRLNGLLDSSRLQHGKRPLTLLKGDLRKPVQSALGAGALRAQAKKIRLRTSLPSNLPPVRFDESAVEVCVCNLLDNAIKYSPAGQTVDVRVVSDRRTVTIAIRDFGRGIAPSQQKRIFEEFVQVDPEGAGCGLGLFVVKQLMDAHGGKVEVDSRSGDGSDFRLVFPR